MATVTSYSAPLQHFHRKAFVKVVIGGQDVTDRLLPYLISVRVLLKSEGWSEASIELDDRNAELSIPPNGTPVMVAMGWSGTGPDLAERPTSYFPEGASWQLAFEEQAPFVFIGYVDSCESGFARRGGGRRLWIDAKSQRSDAEVKEVQNADLGASTGDTLDNPRGGPTKTLGEIFPKVAQLAGMNAVVSPQMAAIKSDYWGMLRESPMMYAQRLARSLGGNFMTIANTMVMFGRNEALYGTVVAEWGINLISWRIKPFAARPQWGSVQGNFFGIADGKWFDTVLNNAGSAPFSAATAMLGFPHAAPNKQVGDNDNAGGAAEGNAQRGTGWVVMNGEPAARAGGHCEIIGARPGVDATYFNREVEHDFSRRGYTTRIDLLHPTFNAGAIQRWIDQGWPKTTPGTPQANNPVPDTVPEPQAAGDVETTSEE